MAQRQKAQSERFRIQLFPCTCVKCGFADMRFCALTLVNSDSLASELREILYIIIVHIFPLLVLQIQRNDTKLIVAHKRLSWIKSSSIGFTRHNKVIRHNHEYPEMCSPQTVTHPFRGHILYLSIPISTEKLHLSHPLSAIPYPRYLLVSQRPIIQFLYLQVKNTIINPYI